MKISMFTRLRWLLYVLVSPSPRYYVDRDNAWGLWVVMKDDGILSCPIASCSTFDDAVMWANRFNRAVRLSFKLPEHAIINESFKKAMTTGVLLLILQSVSVAGWFTGEPDQVINVRDGGSVKTVRFTDNVRCDVSSLDEGGPPLTNRRVSSFKPHWSDSYAQESSFCGCWNNKTGEIAISRVCNFMKTWRHELCHAITKLSPAECHQRWHQ